ncbi:MAG: nicotinamide riboside transporter PnuC [Gammaproteobacteria bacterium]|nr:nicotinamide riboside transporter PnuC [Gammaproteobacteria bacterium]NNL11700.1 nicotinamide mononucleotide transporter [Pseudomonadales bacterium]
MLAETWAELSAYSIPELLAVCASLVYIVLAARNNRYCWPPAFIASILFVVIMWQYGLLMDSMLNAYYAAMAVYGWMVWQAQDTVKPDAQSAQVLPGALIARKSARSHTIAIGVIALLSMASGYWLASKTAASFAYLDSLTTWASLYATWLLAQRVLENWLYWIAIDSLSIYLYLQKGLYFTALLFLVYTAMALYAFYHWRKQSREKRRPLPPNRQQAVLDSGNAPA